MCADDEGREVAHEVAALTPLRSVGEALREMTRTAAGRSGVCVVCGVCAREVDSREAGVCRYISIYKYIDKPFALVDFCVVCIFSLCLLPLCSLCSFSLRSCAVPQTRSVIAAGPNDCSAF